MVPNASGCKNTKNPYVPLVQGLLLHLPRLKRQANRCNRPHLHLQQIARSEFSGQDGSCYGGTGCEGREARGGLGGSVATDATCHVHNWPQACRSQPQACRYAQVADVAPAPELDHLKRLIPAECLPG